MIIVGSKSTFIVKKWEILLPPAYSLKRNKNKPLQVKFVSGEDKKIDFSIEQILR